MAVDQRRETRLDRTVGVRARQGTGVAGIPRCVDRDDPIEPIDPPEVDRQRMGFLQIHRSRRASSRIDKPRRRRERDGGARGGPLGQ